MIDMDVLNNKIASVGNVKYIHSKFEKNQIKCD